MKSTIKDLSATRDLDSRAMSAVHGGTLGLGYLLPSVSSSKFAAAFNTNQFIGQTQTTINNNGNNDAFVSDVYSVVTPSQSAANHNNINLGSHPVA
jgi:hypothetical protein